MERDPYLYPGTDVLINKEGLREGVQLEAFERRMTAQRMAEDLLEVPLTAEGFRQLHHHLFQDVYAWAGQQRTVDISKDNDLFCRTQFIDDQLEKRFEAIRTDSGLRSGNTAETFAESAAAHLCELNAIHPFREGNGRDAAEMQAVIAEAIVGRDSVIAAP